MLRLGLKFAPTPRKTPDPLEFYEKYHQQCLKVFNKLVHTPGASKMLSLIEEHLVAIRERLQATSAGPEEDQARWLNMSSEHKRALFTLRGDKSRTIKPADKGSCIVIQDTEDYLQQGLAFLSDPETYRELESDTSTETAHKANDLLERLHRQGMLTRYTATAHSAKLEELRQQRMYFLKKVHKTPHKLRPIVSCCSGPTQGISKLANTTLSNYLDTVPSLVSSSTQVINILEQLRLPNKEGPLTLATNGRVLSYSEEGGTFLQSLVLSVL